MVLLEFLIAGVYALLLNTFIVPDESFIAVYGFTIAVGAMYAAYRNKQ